MREAQGQSHGEVGEDAVAELRKMVPQSPVMTIGDASKNQRAVVFADFIVQTFGPDQIVADVGGGRGDLALALALHPRNVKATVTDPRPNAGRLNRRLRKQLRKRRNEYSAVKAFFPPKQVGQKTLERTCVSWAIELMYHCHRAASDEATESIVILQWRRT